MGSSCVSTVDSTSASAVELSEHRFDERTGARADRPRRLASRCTVFTQDDRAFPAASSAGPRRRPLGRRGTTGSRPYRRWSARRERGARSNASSAGCAPSGRRSPESPGSARICPSSGPAADRCSRPVARRRAARSASGHRLRGAARRARRARRRDRGAVRPRLDRRAAGRAADREARAAHARRHDAGDPTRWSPSCRPTSSSARSRRSRSTR